MFNKCNHNNLCLNNKLLINLLQILIKLEDLTHALVLTNKKAIILSRQKIDQIILRLINQKVFYSDFLIR